MRYGIHSQFVLVWGGCTSDRDKLDNFSIILPSTPRSSTWVPVTKAWRVVGLGYEGTASNMAGGYEYIE